MVKKATIYTKTAFLVYGFFYRSRFIVSRDQQSFQQTETSR